MDVFSYNEKVYTEPATRRYTYQYMWRWGGFFGPYGSYQGTDMKMILLIVNKQEMIKQMILIRIGGFLKAKLLKGLTVNADYTFNLRNSDPETSQFTGICFGFLGW